MTDFTLLRHCLACGSDNLHRYLDLGAQPLANAFTSEPTEVPSYDIKINVCMSCWHSQQAIAVDPEILYRDYAYASGTSKTLRDYFTAFVERVEQDVGKSGRKFHVLDIASNDGSLLRAFAHKGHFVAGVDPASNLSPEDIPTIHAFWGDGIEEQMESRNWSSFDVIVAMNVLGHVSDPLKFLTLAKKYLAPGGRIYIQTSQAEMLKNADFDTCYHEHLSFFTANSFKTLASRAGLHIVDIEHVAIHGTSYLVSLSADPASSAGGYYVWQREKSLAYYNLDLYATLQSKFDVHVEHVRSTMALLKREGRVLAGYGAAAKAMMFLNYAYLDLAFIMDDSPLKQGKYCPGIGSPVLGEIPSVGKIAWIITAWNFRTEIIARIKAARPECDDKFLTYFPKVTLE